MQQATPHPPLPPELAPGSRSQLSPTYHLILCECACLVAEEVLNSPEFLRDSAGTDEGVWNCLIPLDHP